MLVKYLRVVLDSRLTWRKHVDVKVRKAHNTLCACRRACGAKWGLKTKVVHWLYVSIIRPSITFASLVWWPGCKTASAMRRPSRIQRLACLGITGAMCTTHTSTMEALTCLPQLKLVVQSEARSDAHHLWSLGCWSYLHSVEDMVAHWCGFSSQIPYFIWGWRLWGQHFILNPNIGLLCWLEKSGPEDLGLL
jgi:hypothetical protein